MMTLHEMAVQEGMALGEQRGLQKGAQQASLAIAKKLLSEGANIELIAKATDLSPTDIESLKNK